MTPVVKLGKERPPQFKLETKGCFHIKEMTRWAVSHSKAKKKINKNANTMDNVPLPRQTARSGGLSDAVQ